MPGGRHHAKTKMKIRDFNANEKRAQLTILIVSAVIYLAILSIGAEVLLQCNWERDESTDFTGRARLP